MIADALKTKYPLPVLLKQLKIAKSSYYYQKKRLCFAEKHKDDCQIITTIFHNNMERYGYRRIKVVLNREGYILSEKVDPPDQAWKYIACKRQKCKEILFIQRRN